MFSEVVVVAHSCCEWWGSHVGPCFSDPLAALNDGYPGYEVIGGESDGYPA